MSIDITNINYPVSKHLQANIVVPIEHFLIRLAENIPWAEFGELAIIDLYKNRRKSGKKLNLRHHIGAFILQTLYNCTDRDLEDRLQYYAPARIFCGLIHGKSFDHTAYVKFRNRISEETAKNFNQIIIKVAVRKKFTNKSTLDFDSTVQETNIAYPSDFIMMHKVIKKCGKVLNFLKDKGSKKAEELVSQINFKKIGVLAKEYYFAKKSKNGFLRKVELFKYFQRKTKQITEQVVDIVTKAKKIKLKWNIQKDFNQIKEVVPKLLKQIRYYIKNQTVADKKILSLHMKEGKCISKGKVGKKREFGRTWFIGRLLGNYAFGFTDEDVGLSDADSMEKGIHAHKEIFGEAPESITTDQAFWSKQNIKACENNNVEEIGIAPKGKKKLNITDERAEELRNRRAGVEPIIGHIKRRGLGKSKMKSDTAVKLQGYRAILSLNLARLITDLSGGKLKWAG